MRTLAKARKKTGVKKQHLASLVGAHRVEKLKQKPPKIKEGAEKEEEIMNQIVMKIIRKDLLLETL